MLNALSGPTKCKQPNPDEIEGYTLLHNFSCGKRMQFTVGIFGPRTNSP